MKRFSLDTLKQLFPGGYRSGAAAGVVLLVVMFMWYSGLQSGAGDAQTIAKQTAATCKSATDKAACYERIVPALYPELSVPQIFNVVRALRKEDPSYQFCHVLGHKIGERVVAEDPEKWVDVIPFNPPDGLCSNGYIHGVTGGRFRSEVLSDEMIESNIPDFTRACVNRPGWSPNDLDRSICYHGMGHLYDFITNADLPKALTICSRTTPPEYGRMCIEGVFMQIYQPLEPDDYQLIAQMKVKPTKTTVRAYCASFKDPEYVGACLRESWAMFMDGIRSGELAGSFCSGQPNAQQTENCYQSISSIVGRMSLSDVTRALHACGNFPEEWRGMCYDYSAEAVLEENRTEATKALTVCTDAGGSYTGQCLSYLLSHTDFLFGNNASEYQSFCAALPSAYQPECQQRFAHRGQ